MRSAVDRDTPGSSPGGGISSLQQPLTLNFNNGQRLDVAMNSKNNERIYKMVFASCYPHYLAKAERKGRTKKEVDEIICWLTGYTSKQFEAQLEKRIDFETFFAKAPHLNPARKLITGTICGVRIEAVQEPMMREIRYLDKLIDELAKGRAMEKILRK